jgi:ribonucleoside-diphosphate reductase beta chain
MCAINKGEEMEKEITPVLSTNWNDVTDPFDKFIWDTIKSQIWYPEDIAVASDLSSWRTMTESEKQTLTRVFAGLTRLDSLQTLGMSYLMQNAVTPHEEAVLSAFQFFEAIHAQSYSFVFSTLLTPPEVAQAHDWADNNEALTEKIRIIQEIYETEDDHLIGLKKRAMSCILESCLFFTGFFYSYYLAGNGKMMQVNSLISLILRDEQVHAATIGKKFRDLYSELSDNDKAEVESFVYTKLTDLLMLEERYTNDVYAEEGLVEDVHNFLMYNANKTLQNLGFPPLDPDAEERVNALVLSSILGGQANHDFFSLSGSSYRKIQRGSLTEDQWAGVE